MNESPRDSAGGSGGAGGAVVMVLAVVAAIVGLLVVPSLLADDDSGSDTATESTDTVATTTTAAPLLEGTCGEVHAGHNAAMWDPTSADEMLDAGCPWPYAPFEVAVDGGTENPNLGALFEARRYSDLWDALQEATIGVCTVAPLADAPADGFTFGFRYTVQAGGCSAGDDTVDLVVREYVTRAWRDTSAATLAATNAPVVVFGRWALYVEGDDDFTTNRLFETLVGLGAVTVAPAA